MRRSDYGIGGKRICVDTAYFETFNRDNVTLIGCEKRSDRNAGRRTGLRNEVATFDLDVIVLAIGFDGYDRGVAAHRHHGRNGVSCATGPVGRSQDLYRNGDLGFPNMFIITGPGSPSVFTNMVT